MDGSIPRLDQLYRLKKRYNFTLYCDEAHSFLSIGQTGRGCLEFWNERHPDAPLPSDVIDIQTATLSKAIGGIGGLVCGKAKFENAVRRHMEQLHAQGEEPLSCSTMVQTLWVLGQPTRAAHHIQRLRDMAGFCRQELARFGIYVYGDAMIPVLPVHTGRPTLAAKLSYALRQHGLLATTISHPAVAFWQSRVRITLSADHSDSEIGKLLDAVINAAQIVGLIKKNSLKRRPYAYSSPSIEPSTVECSEASQTYNKILTLIHSSAADLHIPEHTRSVSVTQSGHRSRSIYGLGSGGSRWICGAFPPHLAVESLVARLTGTEAALTYADSSIGLASTIASLCRPLIGYTSHYLLIPMNAPGPIEDGLLIAPRKGAPIVFKYTNLPDLFRLSRELSNKSRSKTYLTIYLNTNHNNTPLDMPSTLSQLSKHKPHTTGLTLLLHSPNSGIASIPSTFNLNQKLPNTQVLITGSFYHMFGLAGAYLAGSTTLIGELRYTSRGYMFTTSPQPFVMSMVQTILEERLAGERTP